MGTAIQRPDGSYRGWARAGDPGELLEGETLVEMDEVPEITTGETPDDHLADGLARPEIQAIFAFLAQQQGTTVEAIQSQAVMLHTAAIAASASKAQVLKP